MAEPPPLLVTLASDGERRLVSTNRLFPLRFFFARYEGKHAGVGEMNLQVFWTPKPPDTLRILLVGASSVQGFPHSRNLNAASFLRAQLRDLLPGTAIETVNLGTTALASFAVRATLAEARDARPDAVVAYLGHNEFFGAYGVASLMRAARSPTGCRWHYALMQSRLVRLFTALGRGADAPEITEKDLMQTMAAVEYIAPDDPCRVDALRHLAHNLGAMADIAAAWGVPFVVCTVVSNERDLVPVRTFPPPLGAAAAADWNRLLEEGTADSLARAESMYAASALLRYRQARLALENRRHDEARALFQSAIELDAMPWRAPPGVNQAIRSLAARPDVFLADVEALFRAEAPHGILGREHFLDHVHPNVRGQELMARAIVAALASALPALGLEPDRLHAAAHYRLVLGDSPAEQFHLVSVMAGLYAKEPLLKHNRDELARLLADARSREAALEPAYRESYAFWKHAILPEKGLTMRPLAMVCADALSQRTPLGAPNLAGAARLFRAGIEGTASHTPLRLEAVAGYFTQKVLSRDADYAAAEKHLWDTHDPAQYRRASAALISEALARCLQNPARTDEVLSAADRQLARDALQMGAEMLDIAGLKNPDRVKELITQLALFAHAAPAQ